eukprot:scaffold6918_cov380-Prasinococcus_capsulatus_cf.AAC.6
MASFHRGAGTLVTDDDEADRCARRDKDVGRARRRLRRRFRRALLRFVQQRHLAQDVALGAAGHIHLQHGGLLHSHRHPKRQLWQVMDSRHPLRGTATDDSNNNR